MLPKGRTIKKEEADHNFFLLKIISLELRYQTLLHQKLSNLHSIGSSTFAEIV